MTGKSKHQEGGPLIDYFVATVPKKGESISGDRSLVTCEEERCLLAAIDGLGHGDEAAAAAERAIATLAAHSRESLLLLMRRCHEALHGTRGVVMTLATINAKEDTMTWLGVGNVEGVLFRADPTATPAREEAMLRGGVVGYQIPQLRASVISMSKGDTLMFATDGIYTGFADTVRLSDSPQQIAEHICAHNKKETDDALVLVVRYHGLQG